MFVGTYSLPMVERMGFECGRFGRIALVDSIGNITDSKSVSYEKPSKCKDLDDLGMGTVLPQCYRDRPESR